MAHENSLKCVTGLAGADLSAKQYYAVNIGAALAVTLHTGDGTTFDGILQNDPASGRGAIVALRSAGGISKAVAGAAITAGADLMSATSGKLITATSTKKTIAKALEAATADGDIITVLFKDSEVTA